MIESQEKQIRKALEAGETLTAIDALQRFGCSDWQQGLKTYATAA